MERKQVINLKQMLEETVRRYGRKTAFIVRDRRVSYTEIDQASNKIANALIKAGINRGDRIAMLLPNGVEFINVYFGIIKAGATAIPLDAKYKAAELTSLFHNCLPRMIVAESATVESLAPLFPGFKSVEMIMEVGGSSSGKSLSYEEIMATGSAESTEIEPQPEDMAHIAYASGPTTRPTGVIASHRNLLKEAEIIAAGFQQTEKDVVMLFALPLYHAFALVGILMTSLYRGSTIVIVPGTGLSIGTLLEAIEREKGTLLFGVPYIFALLNRIAREEGVRNDLSSLRVCGSGGAPLSVNTVRQFKKYFGFNLIDFWGLTEAICIVTCPPLDRVKLGSVGKALPGWEIKIVDENGNELLTNQPGEVIVRGPITEGYYHNPQATAEKIKNSWLYTGDMGRVDKDGYLFLTGLKKRMIILKGKKIYPSDIEEVLSKYPKIAAARVIGIPDRLRGEMVGAVILLKERVEATAQEIKRFCQEHMSDYKLPRQVIFTTQSSLANLSKIANIRLSQRKLKELLSSLSNLPSPLKYKKKPSKAQ